VEWFEKQVSSDSETSNEEDVTHKKKTFKDIAREQLLEDVDAMDGRTKTNPKRSLAYDKEQEDIRKSFMKSVKSSGIESDENSDSDEDILVVKARSYEDETSKEEEEKLQQAIKEMSQLKPDKNEDDEFLTSFMSNKKWISKPLQTRIRMRQEDDDEARRLAAEDEILDLEEDEQELEEVDKFESKYNFRFEELENSGANAHQVVGHSRSIEGSLRREDDSRKKQRETRKERKEKEKRQKEAEIRRLKNLKRQEVWELHTVYIIK
jgi:protein KRI1